MGDAGPPTSPRWAIRYSPSEMMYLEIAGTEVMLWLHHSKERAARYSLTEVCGGTLDAEVNALFGPAVLANLKAAVAARIADLTPCIETKEQAMERRRGEG